MLFYIMQVFVSNSLPNSYRQLGTKDIKSTNIFYFSYILGKIDWKYPVTLGGDLYIWRTICVSVDPKGAIGLPQHRLVSNR
jgi:acyl dehydratase